jgi:hypothetical protein
MSGCGTVRYRWTEVTASQPHPVTTAIQSASTPAAWVDRIAPPMNPMITTAALMREYRARAASVRCACHAATASAAAARHRKTARATHRTRKPHSSRHRHDSAQDEVHCLDPPELSEHEQAELVPREVEALAGEREGETDGQVEAPGDDAPAQQRACHPAAARSKPSCRTVVPVMNVTPVLAPPSDTADGGWRRWLRLDGEMGMCSASRIGECEQAQ